MAAELAIYAMALSAGGVLSLALCGYAAFRFRRAPGGAYYILGTLMAALFNFAYLLELTSATLDQIKFWLRVEYVPLSFLPVFMLLMCFEYVGKRTSRFTRAILFFIPLTIIFMQATNDVHHLYYTSVELRADVPFPIVQLEYGPYFYVHSASLYGSILACVLLLASHARKVRGPIRMQVLAMGAGLIVPVLASFVYLLGESPYGVDLGPVFISVSYVFHCIALFRYRMFNVAPIARDFVFERMEEGVVVLDANEVVIDFNQAASDIIPALARGNAGRPISSVILEGSRLADIVLRREGGDYEQKRGETTSHYRIRFTTVQTRRQQRSVTIITFVNITERVRMERRLQQVASEDALTKLSNRGAVLEQSSAAAKRLAQTGGKLSVIMFDIDRFKQINDTYGHEAGDTALKHVADAVRATIRASDIAGRYGGDEFVVFLPDTAAAEARELADRLRRNVAERDVTANGGTFRIRSSFGIASASIGKGGDSQALQTLMRQADQALYSAKAAGRNQVQMHAAADAQGHPGGSSAV
ncbi:histidine kinase N-terminal 7TM domain-containing diguanylate cyclase [Paenibacillus sp.]|uniref:histidine kinase N-terminal 7TM domain-containing diguanylate cyclase n=1 Tax=Paenibacillus sp. TaxID=58172 RepID=UPI002D4C1F72|nr:histidine kinase N-terminal 7TM domain-containing protein [Paenibacillus sp.]HZG88104.1 histidine kinase N-terminal 7TM domain-containing protein [Paenibacillus sp.]